MGIGDSHHSIARAALGSDLRHGRAWHCHIFTVERVSRRKLRVEVHAVTSMTGMKSAGGTALEEAAVMRTAPETDKGEIRRRKKRFVCAELVEIRPWHLS
eukprot:Skav236337  [mRNA]  locus=scaffold97:316305:316604:- [translate_table: standard]